jgi:hypothetical protein
MRDVERILVWILVINSISLLFQPTNLFADLLFGSSTSYFNFWMPNFNLPREFFLLFTRVPIGILFFVLGLYFSKELKIESFGVAFISFGALSSTLEVGLFVLRNLGMIAVSIYLVLLSSIGLYFISVKGRKK